MFVDGSFHGVGTLNYESGSYLYANFRDDLPTGKILNYDSEAHDWFVIDEQVRESLQEGKGYPPKELDGCKIAIEDCFINNSPFEDEDFDYEILKSVPGHYQKTMKFESAYKVYPEGKLFG